MQDSQVFPVIRLYLERAFVGDTDVIWSSWVSGLETSCLIFWDGMGNTKLENEYWECCSFCSVFTTLSLWCYTVSASCSLLGYFSWGSVEFHPRLQSWPLTTSVFQCSCETADRAGEVVAMLVSTNARAFMVARITWGSSQPNEVLKPCMYRHQDITLRP